MTTLLIVAPGVVAVVGIIATLMWASNPDAHVGLHRRLHPAHPADRDPYTGALITPGVTVYAGHRAEDLDSRTEAIHRASLMRDR